MWADSPFAAPWSSFNRPVPVLDVDPDTGTLVSVCFNPAWLPYIIGCLKQLLLQTTWDTVDPDVLALQQQRAFNLIDLFQEGLCEVSSFQIRACTGEGECGIEWSDDGGSTWTCIPLNDCIINIAEGVVSDALHDGVIGGPGQPSPVEPIPTLECHTYHVSLHANDRWLCPFPVTQGYTVVIANTSGSAWDGDLVGGSAWYCPNGQRVLFGVCSDTGAHTASGDPINTINHMRVVGNIASTWFDALDGTYTVPTGLFDQPLYLQCNDSQLYDNQGEFEFDITVCNETPSYCGSFDFTKTDGGWVVPSGEAGTWVNGVGWEAQYLDGSDNPELVVWIPWDGTPIVAVDLVYSATPGAAGGNGVRMWRGLVGGSSQGSNLFSGPGVAVHEVEHWDVSLSGSDHIEVILNQGTAGGSATLESLVITCG